MEALMRYISRTSRLSILYRSESLEPLGLNGHQHSYLLHICQNPGISQDQLAKKIYVNKSSVARQVALLEQNGFVTRTIHESDRRLLQVYPTEKALQIYPQVIQVLREWNEYLAADFTEEEQTLLLSMMERVMQRAIDRVEAAGKDSL